MKHLNYQEQNKKKKIENFNCNLCKEICYAIFNLSKIYLQYIRNSIVESG